MSRDRFRQIWQSWHFVNNEEASGTDMIQKVGKMLANFLHKFVNVYSPKRELSLDEGIIPWRGRLSFKVYNASKIIKYGILVRIVCEALTGYICNMQIYSGQGRRLNDTISILLEPYMNKGHHVYMDNYYNSVGTSEMLLDYGIRTCGTIRVNRGVPDPLKQITLRRGETAFRRRGDILVQLWKSKRDVRMISTIHPATMIESHNIDWNTRQNIWKPVCVVEYNKYMKGVDRADQYLSYYHIMRRTRKWTKRVALYLINCALFNSYCTFKTTHVNNRLGYKQFLRRIAQSWIRGCQPEDEPSTSTGPSTSLDPSTSIVPSNSPGPSTSLGTSTSPGPSTSLGTSTSQLRRVPRQDTIDRFSMDMKQHKPVKIVTGGKKKHPQRQCRVCAMNKKKALTSYKCESCDVALHRN
jgi:hypothetical protein